MASGAPAAPQLLMEASAVKRQRQEERPARSTVVVLGDTGAGKSSMLNALLGESQLVPTNGMRACTASLIELEASGTSDPRYSGTIEFVSGPEWQQEEEQLYAALTDDQGQLCIEMPKAGTPAHDAWWKLRSVYGRIIPRDELKRPMGGPGVPETSQQVADWLAATLPSPWGKVAAFTAIQQQICAGVLLSMSQAEVEKVLEISDPSVLSALAAALRTTLACPADRPAAVVGRTVQVTGATAKELHAAVRPFVDSADEGAEGALWPLVKRVVLRGPWARHIGRTCLVDAPGVQDENSSRGEMVRSYLRNADAVWLVANIRRAVNDKSVKDMMPLSLRERLLDEGEPGAVSFLATQTDVLVRSEIAHNLQLPKAATIERCALERNAFTRRRLVLDFYQGLDVGNHPAGAAQKAEAEHQGTGPQFKAGSDEQPGSTSAFKSKDSDILEVVDLSGPSAAVLSTPRGNPATLPNTLTTTPARTVTAPAFSYGSTGPGSRAGGGMVQQRLMPVMHQPPDPKQIALAAARGAPLLAVVADVRRILAPQESALHTAVRQLKRPAGREAAQGIEQGQAEKAHEAVRGALTALASAEAAIASHTFTYEVFCVSAVEAQKYEGVRVGDGPPAVFTSLEDTGIPALRAHARRLSSREYQKEVKQALTTLHTALAQAAASVTTLAKGAPASATPVGSRKLHAAIEALEAAGACVQSALTCHDASPGGTLALKSTWGGTSSSGSSASQAFSGLDLSISAGPSGNVGGSQKGKPGAWMLDAVNKVREEAAAEDIPP